MAWGDQSSLEPVKTELERILSLPPTDRKPWLKNLQVDTNAHKIVLLESTIIEMLRGPGGGMTAGARRELLWKDFLCSASKKFNQLGEGLSRDADYSFHSNKYGLNGISHKSVGYNGGNLALSWGNNPVPLDRIFESPILIVCYRKQTRGRWANIRTGAYLIPLDFCKKHRAELKKNNRTDHLINAALLVKMLNHSVECDLFIPLPYVHEAGKGLFLSDWTDTLNRIKYQED
jgi:hypothetical protein